MALSRNSAFFHLCLCLLFRWFPRQTPPRWKWPSVASPRAFQKDPPLWSPGLCCNPWFCRQNSPLRCAAQLMGVQSRITPQHTGQILKTCMSVVGSGAFCSLWQPRHLLLSLGTWLCAGFVSRAFVQWPPKQQWFENELRIGMPQHGYWQTRQGIVCQADVSHGYQLSPQWMCCFHSVRGIYEFVFNTSHL